MKSLFKLISSVSIVSLSILGACRTPEPNTVGRMVGSDRDSHGCISSAGYQWSNALHDCIRPWENGIRLNRNEHSIFVIFSRDSVFCEIMGDSTIDNRLCKRIKGTRVWRNRLTDEQVIVQGNKLSATTITGNYFYSPEVTEKKFDE